ncbi:MAG: type II toxin-antitoxin system RatA family toxin [Alphaproteobacteria bacterium]|nr:type II toxin-antitoxin system RatA family toxin [Alphaproteobacteria bacterium]
MPRHFEKRILPYTCEQVYALVADVEHYPDFLPWCIEANVIRNEENCMRAILSVGYKSFRETFTSLVRLEPPHAITVEYGGGPLKHLSTHWAFKPIDDHQCEISFSLSFELKSFLFGAMMDLFFDKAFRSMVSAFEARAHQLYGEISCKT